MKKLSVWLLAAALLPLGFVWGYLARRDGVFPYELLRRWKLDRARAEALNIRARAAPPRELLASQSKSLAGLTLRVTEGRHRPEEPPVRRLTGELR